MRALLAFLGLLAGALQAQAPRELAGLWTAQRWYGPTARGALVIERTAAGLVADMMGRRVPVRVEHGEWSFSLPAGQGTFRGKPEPDGSIHGTWTVSSSVTMGGHAVPVRLARAGRGRWLGEVVPLEDVFTFHLLLQERPDGALGALLRNPQRDLGAVLGVDRLERDGSVLRLLGRRRGQAESQEVASGEYVATDSMLVLRFSGAGGTFEFRRDDEQSAFYPRGQSPPTYAYAPPQPRDDGWPTGTLDEAGIDRAAAERFVQLLIELPMDSVNAPQVQGLLIARHGRLVLEEYFHGEHRDHLRNVRSASKSVTATLIGAAIHAGAPLRLTSPVYQVMNGGSVAGDLDPRKRAMTLRDLLTMSSGFYCDDGDLAAPGREDTMWDQQKEPDFYRYTLAVPMAFTPGERAIYCSGNPNLALGMLGRATGESPTYTFDRLLAQPLRIERYAWSLDRAGNPYGGGGMQFRLRDFAKFGQLMLDGGVWHGRRILDRAFVDSASAPLYPLGGRRYGLLWWSMDLPWLGRTVRAYAALGAGGQSITVVPQLDLVIAGFGASYASRGYRFFLDELVPNHILPAVRGTRPG